MMQAMVETMLEASKPPAKYKSRAGRVNVSVRVEKRLAADMKAEASYQKRTIEECVVEAFEMWLAKQGAPASESRKYQHKSPKNVTSDEELQAACLAHVRRYSNQPTSDIASALRSKGLAFSSQRIEGTLASLERHRHIIRTDVGWLAKPANGSAEEAIDDA
jgi:hypothetical protein